MAVAQPVYFTEDFTLRLDEILRSICEDLQISEARYKQAEERYKSVNSCLEDERSPFYAFTPEIYPQGSMRLNTTVKPVTGPHDLDFVLELAVAHHQVDPMKLLHSLYVYLRNSPTYSAMTSLKNRCVRIEYANEFYMDLLIGCRNYSAHEGCIKVPDRKAESWKDSNPRGYAAWFESRSALYQPRFLRAIEAAEPIPQQQSVAEKTPLQLAVQLLKRWRDLRYPDAELAPISIVLTTLAAEQYSGELSVSAALTAVLAGMVAKINAADLQHDRVRVHNPSNTQEDLSERWDKNLKAYNAFREGIRQFHSQWTTILGKQSNVAAELESLFGEPVKNAFTKQARRLNQDHERGMLGVTNAGLIAPVTAVVRKTPQHTFYGDQE